jgi:predicted TIM-barrel fold metal-dependent hydrolase
MFLAKPLFPRQKLLMLTVARSSGLTPAQLDELSEAIDLYPDRFIGMYNARPRQEDLKEILEDELWGLRELPDEI